MAAALRLSLDSTTPLTRTWIVYNKPPVPTYSNAGVLLALGLLGEHLMLACVLCLIDACHAPTHMHCIACVPAWPFGPDVGV